MAIDSGRSEQSDSDTFILTNDNNKWKSPASRQAMVNKMQSIIEETGLYEYSAADLEDNIYQNSKTKPEYVIMLVYMMQQLKKLSVTQAGGAIEEDDDFMVDAATFTDFM
ncbi:unnamed protein product [Spodoptera exigua]|uniref:Mediator of RNA polymerase II transcription subunit 15 n=1 Tax=Spodoptera exigua TaxID=7107 RepID=A0A835L4D6_SPOEX|nr:hypothetical protein HW555_006638 [Spodoptera exigua]CAH0700860.1 unnamed protein product [Spodoptera exigua]